MSTIRIQVENESTGPSLNAEPGEQYRVWASDNQVYGPVGLSVLHEWAKDSRVFGDTWIYSETQRNWRLAELIPELRGHLMDGDDTVYLTRQAASTAGIDPFELRVFPVMASLSNHDLAHFIRLCEVVVAEPGDFIIRRREPADSIFFVLSGSVRVRITVGYDEKVLGKIPPGQFLGEISMFTNTVRTADVIAEEQTRLLRFSSEGFRKLIHERPGAAAPMLYNISAMMARRTLETNVKFQDEVAGGFVWR